MRCSNKSTFFYYSYERSLVWNCVSRTQAHILVVFMMFFQNNTDILTLMCIQCNVKLTGSQSRTRIDFQKRVPKWTISKTIVHPHNANVRLSKTDPLVYIFTFLKHLKQISGEINFNINLTPLDPFVFFYLVCKLLHADVTLWTQGSCAALAAHHPCGPPRLSCHLS